jgi:hypothetical protein
MFGLASKMRDLLKKKDKFRQKATVPDQEESRDEEIRQWYGQELIWREEIENVDDSEDMDAARSHRQWVRQHRLIYN